MSVAIMNQLAPVECHWEVLIPTERGTLFGQQLLLAISTDWSADRTRPLPVSSSELSLADLILAELPTILKQAEAEFLNYEKDEASPVRHVLAPRIWIDRDAIAEDGPFRWALVVHHNEWPDFGWHVEFDGTRFIEIWAGS